MKRASKDKSLIRHDGPISIPRQPDFNPAERYPGGKPIVSSTTEVTTMRHSGPLPAPSVLAEYDRVVPGLAERIVAMSESQFAHRVEKEKASLEADISIAQRTTGYVLVGQIFSFIVSMTAILAGAWVAAHGQPWVAGALGTGGVASLVIGILQAKNPPQLPPADSPKAQSSPESVPAPKP
jgi:uncharacterized membrane protein